MKRILLIAITALTLSSALSYAQGVKFGVQAGFTSASANFRKFDANSISRYNFGVLLDIPLAGGFAFQPGIIYQTKGASADKIVNDEGGSYHQSLSTKSGFFEIPLQFQWGPDLMAFRPYVLAEPFIGFGVNTRNKTKIISQDGDKMVQNSYKCNSFDRSGLSRFEYGVGLGFGVDVWKLRFSCKWFWNFGSLSKDPDGTPNHVAESIKSAFNGSHNYDGFTFSTAFFF